MAYLYRSHLVAQCYVGWLGDVERILRMVWTARHRSRRRDSDSGWDCGLEDIYDGDWGDDSRGPRAARCL